MVLGAEHQSRRMTVRKDQHLQLPGVEDPSPKSEVPIRPLQLPGGEDPSPKVEDPFLL
eukprot:COSAG02_NODE_42895_length_380_cov_0.718861_1_plen_57_part_01